MHLMYYIKDGKRVYTLKIKGLGKICECVRFQHSSDSPEMQQKENQEGNLTDSAHPARFSPDDKFSAARVAIKTRFGLLPTQKPPLVL